MNKTSPNPLRIAIVAPRRASFSHSPRAASPLSSPRLRPHSPLSVHSASPPPSPSLSTASASSFPWGVLGFKKFRQVLADTPRFGNGLLNGSGDVLLAAFLQFFHANRGVPRNELFRYLRERMSDDENSKLSAWLHWGSVWLESAHAEFAAYE
eukprot:gnl/Trimastix_PCT/4325.p1 GENE.gnl/Trimastix_PCT/4325~~gnl/Trimastix_PCT/4325.p1  ORF type:complete len:153 (+),score=1.97 gnl/Trimastix_PCT/4325:33-491(+)